MCKMLQEMCAQVAEEVREKVTKEVTGEVTERVMIESAYATAKQRFRLGKLTMEEIAECVGLSAEEIRQIGMTV